MKNINLEILLIAIFITSVICLTNSCSITERLVYYPKINQGNYLSDDDVAKIQKGMNKQQVMCILGTPIIKEPFGQPIWYYISRQQLGYTKVKQQTLKLVFDTNGLVVNIRNTLS